MKLHTIVCAGLFLFACSGGDDDDDQSAGPPQCNSAAYVAFDPANYTPQQLRLQAYVDMVELMDAAKEDVGLAPTNFAEAFRLYRETASLQEKVMGRVDVHFDDPPPIGVTLDQTIVSAFEAGQTATTSFALDIATETVEKTLLHFFFLSVYFEMNEGERQTWDEAFGYWGANASNDEASRKGLALVATERSGTASFSDLVFNSLLDGSCELAKALEAGATEPVDPDSHPGLSGAIVRVDLQMQMVFAFFAGHEAVEMAEQQRLLPDPDASAEIEIELLEFDLLFQPLEPLMLKLGGDSAARATRMRATLDAAKNDQTGRWKTTIEPAALIEDLEDEYGIAIRG